MTGFMQKGMRLLLDSTHLTKLKTSPSLKNVFKDRDFRMQSKVSPTARYFSIV